MASSVPPLLAGLAAEHRALLDFVALLEREQKMLVNGLTDSLQELSEQKSTGVLNLNNLAQTRLAILKQFIPQPNVTAINDWLTTHSHESLILWGKILELAERSRKLNHANGELVQLRLRHNQQSLAVLSSAVSKTTLYGSDGQPSFSPGSGRSLGRG